LGEPNYHKTKYYYQLASENGEEDAMLRYSEFLELGIEGDQDLNLAFLRHWK
jgi:TPR repeat protein